MKTHCNQKTLEFQSQNSRKIVAHFNGGNISSDAGGLLLQQTERITGIIAQFSNCFTDHRDPDLSEHTLKELIAQRVYALALGYEDLNDHDELRNDSLLAVMVGKKDPTGNDRIRKRDKGKPLAGLCREHIMRWCEANEVDYVLGLAKNERLKKEIIKEQQLSLFADRTSAATMRANQLRLWFSSVAYTLMNALRRLGLKGTKLARAQCGTIRLKLLKIGAQIKVTVRKVWVSLSESYPYQQLFKRVYENLCRLCPTVLRC